MAVLDWAKTASWSIPEVEKAARAGNWGLIEARSKSLKKNWDLGVQKMAFLGIKDQNGASGKFQGLLTLSAPKVNTTTITKFIKDMNVTELKAFIADIVGQYRKNSNFTAWPTTFIIPENDWNGLPAQASADFPVISTKKLVLEALKDAVPNGGFKNILPLSYANADKSPDGKNTYALLNYDEESLRMTIPVDFTTTVPNTLNGFQMQYVAYGEATGVTSLKPREILFFKF
jgi:hypothetical protein